MRVVLRITAVLDAAFLNTFNQRSLAEIHRKSHFFFEIWSKKVTISRNLVMEIEENFGPFST